MVFIRSSQLPSAAITTAAALHANNNYNYKKRLSSSFYNILCLVTISIPFLYLLGITNYLTNSTTSVHDDERRMHNLKKEKKLNLTDIADIMYNSRLKLNYQCLGSSGSSHTNSNSELRDLIARTDQVIILYVFLCVFGVGFV